MAGEKGNPFSFELLTDVHWASQDLARYLVFSAEVETALAKSLAELEAEVAAEVRKLPKEDQTDYFEIRLEELHNHDIFPHMHRETMVISLHNYLEHRLNTICTKIGEELGSRVKLKHLQGKGIVRALLYLRLVAQFDLSAVNDRIAFLQNSNRLRNCIVHNDSTLPSNENDDLNKFVRAEPALAGDSNEPVTVRAEFLTSLVENVSGLFEEISAAMQRYMKANR